MKKRLTKTERWLLAAPLLISLWIAFKARFSSSTLSHFWDSKRVEKAVHAEVVPGSSEAFVTQWLRSAGIEQRRIVNNTTSFGKQNIVAASGLKTNEIGSLIVGETQEGLALDDLYWIQVTFFFDKRGKLIKYSFFKIWRGL